MTKAAYLSLGMQKKMGVKKISFFRQNDDFAAVFVLDLLVPPGD